MNNIVIVTGILLLITLAGIFHISGGSLGFILQNEALSSKQIDGETGLNSSIQCTG